MRHTSAAFVLALTITACQPIKPPAPVAPRTSTAISASFGRTWDAAIDAFASRGISIETLDRSSGLIVPAGRTYVPNNAGVFGSVEDATKYADCGSNVLGNAVRPASVKYNVVVRGDSTRSGVQVRAFYLPGADGRSCESRGLFESEAEASIKAKAELPQ